MKRLFLSLLILSIPFFVAQKSYAACQPIYGGGPTCTNSVFSIEKQVLNPQANFFVHDLGLNDPKYHGNDLIPFQITITNAGSSAIQQVVVHDTFPKELQFSDGPGSYDSKTRTLTFVVKNIAPHHAELFTINTHAVAQDQFTSSEFCITNQASAIPSMGNPAQDSSQVCLSKITSTPSTGPTILEYIVLIVCAGIGMLLHKSAKISTTI